MRLMGIGVPMGLQCSITAIGSVIMQWAVNMRPYRRGRRHRCGKTQNLLTVPLESVGTAMATYAGQNLGASRMDRAQGYQQRYADHSGVWLGIRIYPALYRCADYGPVPGYRQGSGHRRYGPSVPLLEQCVFCAAGWLIIWRYTIQGLGLLAGNAGRCGGNDCRTAVAIILVPILGNFGAELANPAAWVAACLFLYPAYRWTCSQLDNRLLAAKLHIQGNHAETVL